MKNCLIKTNVIKNSLIKKIQPYAAKIISSAALLNVKRYLFEAKRRLLGKPHEIDIYVRINDPYSYLLVQVLADFEQRFKVSIQFKTILQLQDDMYPETEMWHDNGFIDAAHLAQLYALKFPSEAPQEDSNRVQQGTHCLLRLETLILAESCDWQQVSTIFDQYWFQKTLSSSDISLTESALADQLINNERALAAQGHYMSAVLNYAGEWYWGLDRLDHLEKRLHALNVHREPKAEEVLFNKTYIDFCRQPAIARRQVGRQGDHQTDRQIDNKLVVFFSIRSPYSHLGLQQAVKLAQHYKLTLEIKPILPMIMRGLSVPKTKKMYIFHDTKREADKLGIDYGFVADPLGQGVENCYLLFNYAQSLGREQQFLLNYAQAVNAQGIRSETEAGLKVIVQRSGLDWDCAKSILQNPAADQEWRLWAENNRLEMLALGSWGVPTFQYGNLVLWGQDRIGIIEREIREQLYNFQG
jgi:2-hydroxychromene-2-carboxylate isomerase